MPELPEVETVIRTLERQLGNVKITDLDVLYEPVICGPADLFRNAVVGKMIKSYKRRGKYLLFELDDICLVAHLRMEGKFYIYPGKTTPSKHDHLIFTLSDGREVHYNDVRKFGRFELIPLTADYRELKDLGPEPFASEFNPEYIRGELKKRHLPIKSVLLDQSFVAGVGNIYADEILYRSRIHPLLPGCLISNKEIKRLRKNVSYVLEQAVKQGGSTIRSYTSSLGVTGLFQNSLEVYGRKGEPCSRCGSNIVKINVGGRGTHFCPHCQKNKRRIAITGTIGSGKSTVSAIIREHGFEVFDADAVNKELLDSETVLNLLREEFPEAFEKGQLDKATLSDFVFADPLARKKLEGIMHPLIHGKMQQESRGKDLFIAEIPLLFESGFDKYFDYAVCVTTSQDILLERMKKRGFEKEETLRRLGSQYSAEKKAGRSDYVIRNDGNLKQLKKETERWLKGVYAWKKQI